MTEIKNKFPLYWLTIIILLLILAGNVLGQFPPIPLRLQAETDPNMVLADLNGDGMANMVDFALFVRAYQAVNGSMPKAPPPNELSLLKMEVQLLSQANAMLDNELRLERGRNTVEINQYQQQLGLMLLSKFEGMINNVRQPLNVYLYDVSGVGGIHITFDDPNGVIK